jgi:hypothetical protein
MLLTAYVFAAMLKEIRVASKYMKMSEFTPIQNRDASHVIRGYVYQVDLTIERWLQLASDQVLVLECGEDIDTVSSVRGPDQVERLLEQVKHREIPLTLRNRDALTALACAIEHKNSNPDHNLIFRYITNAPVTREKPSIFEHKIPAIKVWENIRNGQLDKSKKQKALDALLVFLEATHQPDGLNKDIWQAFVCFVSSATSTELLEFVKVFEWSTGGTPAEKMQSRIVHLLIDVGKANDTQDAKAKYERLFLYVFKLLSKKDVKELTPEQLEAQLALPVLNTQDQEQLLYIQSMLASLEVRISVAEKTIEANRQNIEMIHPIVQKLARDRGIDPDIQYAPIEPVIDIPPLVAQASNRKETISQIVEELKDHTWIMLTGTVGMGKTQLAILLAQQQQLGECKAWICFRGKGIGAICDYFDRSIELMAGHSLSARGRSRFSIACEGLETGDLIVLDDMPELRNNQDLSTRLLLFLEECTSRGIKIISTGTIPLPTGFCDSAGDNLKVLDVPPFTEPEISEILQAYGASPTDAKSWSMSVNTLALGHPVLTVAIARYLKGVSWHISLTEFDSLFVKHNYTKAVNPETIRRLLDTVEDLDCREFLYRLNLITYSFTKDDAKAVAFIKPQVKRPCEKLAILDGVGCKYSSATKSLFFQKLILEMPAVV